MSQQPTPPPAPDVTAPVRRLDAAELPACLSLSKDREWPHEDRKWALLFEVGEVYGIDAPDGGLAGVVVATRYGTGVTAISMMLVAERFGRRGLGRRLMNHALEHCRTDSFSLTATDDGRPLYERVGFRTTGLCFKYTGVYRPAPQEPTGPATRPARAGDLPAVLALDAEVFGAPRDQLLRRLQTFGEDFRVVDGPGGIAGFGGCWRNVDNTVIGPVVAQDTAVATALIADLAAGAGGECRLDLEDRKPQLLDWAAAHGFTAGSTTAVMVHGADLPGDRSRLFTPVMVALG
ncbi:GNAT family N-acetyltransferase [Streptomyces sp. NPDC051956]|uniref:GNAT family N-acetyltransferase n=1 Tax=Streptomyces sp. NPDC051956 TaxID=3365677 RepID=UPI0037D8D9EE